MLHHERLVALLATKSLRRGEFVLASGAESSYYIDARLTTMHPEGLTTVAHLSLRRFEERQWAPDAVGGLTLGADPIAYAIAYESARRQQPVRAFTVRKEAKTHGTGRLIEGPLAPEDSVVIVEDVLTTGRSALTAARAVSAFGARVIGVLAVVDREQGGIAKLEAEGFLVTALVTLEEILRAAEHSERS